MLKASLCDQSWSNTVWYWRSWRCFSMVIAIVHFSDCCHLCLPVSISPAVSRMIEASVATAAGEAERCVWCFIYTLIFIIKHGSGGLTLAGCQVSTKLLYHAPPQQDRMEEIRWKKIMGQSKGSSIKWKHSLHMQKQRKTIDLLSTSHQQLVSVCSSGSKASVYIVVSPEDKYKQWVLLPFLLLSLSFYIWADII